MLNLWCVHNCKIASIYTYLVNFSKSIPKLIYLAKFYFHLTN